MPRRDVERLRQILGLQRRLTDMLSSPRAKRALIERGPFPEALTWLEIHGQAPEIVEHWRGFLEAIGPVEPVRRASRSTWRRAAAPPAGTGGGGTPIGRSSAAEIVAWVAASDKGVTQARLLARNAPLAPRRGGR